MYKRILVLIAISVLLMSGCSLRISKHRHYSRDPHRITTVRIQPGHHSHRARSRRHVPHLYFHQSQGRPLHQVVNPSRPNKCSHNKEVSE